MGSFSGVYSASARTLRTRMRSGVRAAKREWVEWFFPERCELCRTYGPCAEHPWPEADASPRCLRCAALLAPGIRPRLGCGTCFGTARRVTRGLAETVALFPYGQDAMIRPWVLALKHGARPDLAVPLGALMATHPRARAWCRDGPPILVPVPIHRWRRWSRGYNQAGLLADQVAADWPSRKVAALYRTRPTPPQGSLGSLSRGRNVHGAFAVHPEMRPRLAGSRIVLIDDVFTSGATLGEAARCLRREGAAWVGALVLARVEPSGAEPLGSALS